MPGGGGRQASDTCPARNSSSESSGKRAQFIARSLCVMGSLWCAEAGLSALPYCRCTSRPRRLAKCALLCRACDFLGSYVFYKYFYGKVARMSLVRKRVSNKYSFLYVIC